MKGLLFASALLFSGICGASELVYTPVSPSFGGNPLNGSTLLSSAQAVNKYKDPAEQVAEPTPLETFNTNLQQFILNRIAASVTGSVIDAQGKLIPGVINTQDFTISIASIGNGVLSITTVDKATGQQTVFQVQQ